MPPVASLPEPHMSVELRDMSDVEEGGSGQCGPTIGPGKEWMKGTLEELDDITGPYGPVRHGKNMFKSDKNRGLQSRFKTISFLI